MSKIGKKPIEIPAGVQVLKQHDRLTIKGPLGENVFEVDPKVEISQEGNQIIVAPALNQSDKFTQALWGTVRAILANKIIGVKTGFQVDLILEGLGYGAEVKGDEIVFKLGYNHLVFIPIPPEVKTEVKPQKGFFLITVKGIDKDQVGQFAGCLRQLKPAEPYKGKGFRYVGEKIRRKTVKKLAK